MADEDPGVELVGAIGDYFLTMTEPQQPSFGDQPLPPPGVPGGPPPGNPGYPPYGANQPGSYPPPPPGYGAPPPGYPYPQPGYGYGFDPYGNPVSDKSKMAAGLLQIFLGGFGVGRFYLGYTSIGIAQIAVTWLTCGIGGIWPLIDGIMMLTGSVPDAQGRRLRD